MNASPVGSTPTRCSTCSRPRSSSADAVDQRLGHRLDREGLARVADLVDLAVDRRDDDAEPGRVGLGQFGDVGRDLAAGQRGEPRVQLLEVGLDGRGGAWPVGRNSLQGPEQFPCTRTWIAPAARPAPGWGEAPRIGACGDEAACDGRPNAAGACGDAGGLRIADGTASGLFTFAPEWRGGPMSTGGPDCPGVGAYSPADFESGGAILAVVDACPYAAVLEPELNLRLAKILNLALLSCVAALGLGRPAEAAYVVVNADPAFGPRVPQSGLAGKWCAVHHARKVGLVSFAAVGCPIPVYPAFRASPVLPLGQCACPASQDVELYFYNRSDDGQTDRRDDRHRHLTRRRFWSRERRKATSIQELVDFAIDGSQLVGFHTSSAHTTLPALRAGSLAGSGEYDFALEFSSDDAHLVAHGSTGRWISLEQCRHQSSLSAIDIADAE